MRQGCPTFPFPLKLVTEDFLRNTYHGILDGRFSTQKTRLWVDMEDYMIVRKTELYIHELCGFNMEQKRKIDRRFTRGCSVSRIEK